MQGIKYINKEIPVLESLCTIAQVYQETSIVKIQEVRFGVVRTRDYLAGLSRIYSELKVARSVELRQLAETKIMSSTASGKIQKTLIVLLSANTKLYGAIVQDVYRLFIDSLKNEPNADIMIVGRLGERLFKETGMDRQHLFFEVPDTNLQTQDLEPIIFHIVKYEKVIVFHGKFYNLMTQRAIRANITGETLDEGKSVPVDQGKKRFLFEPNLEKLIEFFETQIFATLFRQTVHESELARYASRVNAMEESLQFIKRRQKNLIDKKRRFVRLRQQKKQLERLSGMSLWQ